MAVLSRRGFLVMTGAAGGGLALGLPLFEEARGAAPVEAYVRITPDNIVTVLSAHLEMGQGVYCGLATLVAEELGADPAQMRVEGASGNTKLYGNLVWGGKVQGTGGSTAMASSFERYRRAGATARAMLAEAAARAWSVPAGEIVVEQGVLRHDGLGQSALLGQFAEAAATLPVPATVTLKDPKEWRYIGKESVRRVDGKPKSTGQQLYTIDVNLPGMLTAIVAHPPLFGAQVKSFDPNAAKAIKGVVEVVRIPQGIAVLAETTWAAIRGREALTVEWDRAQAETRGTAELMAEYRRLAAQPPMAVAERRGDADGAMAKAVTVVEAAYEFPYLAHAALEPLNAVVRRQGDVLEIWGGHQAPDLYQAKAAEAAGLAPDKVKLHVMTTGGSFGRRACPDADIVLEAVECAKAIGWRAPVKVQWTREDDMTGGRYRPAYLHVVKAGIDAAGNPVAWTHHVVGQSILAGTPFAPKRGRVDGTSVEGGADTRYAIPNFTVGLTTTQVGVPVLWWRSVGHSHTAYVMETMIDELAVAAGRDPVDYRRALLQGQPRHRRVLDLAAEKAGWGDNPAPGRFRGVAVHECFKTVVAEVAEISLNPSGGFKVERVVCAVDCGVAINPDQIRAQMEGGIGFGLGAILHSRLTLTEGRVDQTNYDGYQVLRLPEMPRVEVYVVPSPEPPTGVGEPGVPPIGPAIANALAAATGSRVRMLPMNGAAEA